MTPGKISLDGKIGLREKKDERMNEWINRLKVFFFDIRKFESSSLKVSISFIVK